MTLLLPLAGTLLLLLLALDVFVTVLQPEGHGGPLTRHGGRMFWRGWKKLAPRGDGRNDWLALGGPLLALLTPAVWALLLVAAFALIYYPWIESFLASPGALRGRWTEVLYFSGIAAATLGTGDIVPDLPALRLLSVAEALSGFALLSASLTYILAIYRENGRKTTLATELALHHDVQPEHGRPVVAAQRDTWLEHVARELLHITQSHAQYPILHYFRPRDPDRALVLQLRPLMAAGTDTHPDHPADRARQTPTPLIVAAAVERYLEAADRRFVRTAEVDREGDTTEARYRRLLTYLGYSPEDARGA